MILINNVRVKNCRAVTAGQALADRCPPNQLS